MDCSVVIVNYKTDALLEECLRSLQAASSALATEVIVVDNSASLSEGGFSQRFPDVQLLVNPENVGFARASNQGLRAARGRNLLLLNPDTVVHPGAVETMSRYLDSHPRAGAVGARLLNPDGTLQHSCRRFPGYFTVFFGRYALLTRLLPRNRISRHYLYLDWDHDDAAREVDWVSGACMMVRREVLETVGFLDEGYFLFVEDMDWCHRIHDSGSKVAYLPDAVVTHHIGVSRRARSVQVVWARHRAMLRYFRKHFHPPWPVRGVVALGLVVRAGLLVVAAAVGPRR